MSRMVGAGAGRWVRHRHLLCDADLDVGHQHADGDRHQHRQATFTSTATPTSTATSTATATGTTTSTATPTVMPTDDSTATATHTRAPDGAGCVSETDCISGFCGNDVCCNTACDEPGQRCNLPPNVGTCQQYLEPAPALFDNLLYLAMGVLIGITAWSMSRLGGSS